MDIVRVIIVLEAMRGISTTITSILILVFGFTGLDKLLNWDTTYRAFHNQTFPSGLAEALAYLVPALELLVVGLLLFHRTRWLGFLASLLLLSVFVTYVGLVWVGAFPRVPCGCAGIMESLGWAEHFFLNLVLLALSALGLWLRGNKKAEANNPGF